MRDKSEHYVYPLWAQWGEGKGNELTIAYKRLLREVEKVQPSCELSTAEVAARQQVIHLETFLSLSVPSRVEAIILSRGREEGRKEGWKGSWLLARTPFSATLSLRQEVWHRAKTTDRDRLPIDTRQRWRMHAMQYALRLREVGTSWEAPCARLTRFCPTSFLLIFLSVHGDGRRARVNAVAVGFITKRCAFGLAKHGHAAALGRGATSFQRW